MRELIGQDVDYKDVMKLRHTGRIIGMSEDKQWYLVKSDKPNAPKADWHFKIAVESIEGYLKHDTQG